MTPGSRSHSAVALGWAALLVVAIVAGTPASAQEGRVAGRVTDPKTGAPLKGVTVILSAPVPAGGGEPRQEFRLTDSSGEYVFTAVPAGRYVLEFLLSGYESARLSDSRSVLSVTARS